MSNQNLHHHPDVPQPKAMPMAISSHWRQRKWKRKRRLVGGASSPFQQLYRFTSGMALIVALTCLSDWTQALDIVPTSNSTISLASTPASDVESLLKEVPTDLSQAPVQAFPSASVDDELKPEDAYAYDYSELGSGFPAYYEYHEGVSYQYYQDGEIEQVSSQDKQTKGPKMSHDVPNMNMGSIQSQMPEEGALAASKNQESPLPIESQEHLQSEPAQYTTSAHSTTLATEAPFDMELRNQKATEELEKILSEPVDPDDPVLHEVFPQFAAEYKADMDDEARGMEAFSFVNHSDFTLMGERGEVEKYGSIDDLEQVFDELSQGQDRMDSGEKDQQSSHEQLLSALSETGGTTTLMLFNIFTPDEVDFLSELVGEDVVNELKDEVESDLDGKDHLPKEVSDHESTETLEMRESLQKYNHPHATSSRRPFLPNPSVPKNARPSSQDNVVDLQGSSSVEPRFSTTTKYQGLAEEGLQLVTRKPEMSYSYTIDSLDRHQIGTSTATPTTPSPQQQRPLVTKPPNQKVKERKEKFKNLLDKLSSKYSHRLKKPKEPTKEKNEDKEDMMADKMKDMIENLKKSLENTRPGVNRLTLDDVYEVQPHTFTTPSYQRTTTSKPVPLKSVKSMIGDKIKSLGGGIHRLELDDVIDLDVVNIQTAKSKDSDSDSANSQQEMTSVPGPLEPQGPPHSKHLPKRQIVHPKLMYQRANPDIIHRPSINLKSVITPSPDIATAESIKLNHRPMIARYTDAYSYTPRKPSGNYRKGSYMSLQATGSTIDPYPETKELPPYHYPTSGHLIPATVSPRSRYHSTTLRPVSRPTSSPNASPSTTGSPYYFASTTYPLEYQESSEQATTPKYVMSSSIREGKHHGVYNQSPTHFPPPSSQYKQPSLQFHGKKAQSDEISVTPKNTPSYSTPSYEEKSHSTPTPHALEYSTTLSPNEFPETVKSYLPPSKEYLPPKSDHDEHGHKNVRQYQTPNQDYLPPRDQKEHMKHYRVPGREYLPPNHHADMIKYGTPSNEYLPPKHVSSREHIRPKDYMTKYSVPQKDYLPPFDEMAHMKPPRSDYLEPELGVAIELDTHSSKEIGPSHFHTGMKQLNPPNKSYIPPHNDMRHMRPPTGKYDVPSEHMEQYQPPNKAYLPPHKDMEHYEPPNKGYLPPHEDMEHYKPPNKGYLPPHEEMEHYKPPNKGYLPPHEDMKHYKPPNKGYLPPHKDMEHYKPPNKGYLPPHKDMEHYKPPNKEHLPLHENMEHYEPPNKGYLPPHQQMEHYKPPSKSYLPPHEDMEHYKPPSKGYLPPHKDMEHYKPPNKGYLPPHEEMEHYKPPNKGYLPPHEEMEHYKPPNKRYLPPHEEMEHYKPPNKGYLPPHKDMEHYKPPNKGYLPPHKDMEHYKPPNKGYLPPHEEMEHYKPPNKSYPPPHEDMERYKPPNKGYLPPHKDMEHYEPPNKGYLPPHEDMEHYEPPNKSYRPPHEDMEHYKPPSKGYLPPHEDMEHYKPPSKGYLPPHEDMEHYEPPNKGYLPSHKDMEHYEPPNKGYLPPHEDMEHYEPPNKGYLPPQKDMEHYQPPNKGYLPPHKDMEHYEPPHKGYLPPHKDMEHYEPPNKGYLPPYKNNDQHDHVAQMQPPSKGYLPPHKDMQHMKPPREHYQVDKDHMSHYKPPSKGYLPPEDGMKHLQTPSKAYLPPKSTTSYVTPHPDMIHAQTPSYSDKNVGHDMEHMQPPSHGYLSPKKRPLLSPAHYESCPKVPPKSGEMCKGHQKDTCSENGTRDKHCPYEGLCCFDGCAHVCLPPDYGSTFANTTTKAAIPSTLAPHHNKSSLRNFCPQVKKRDSCEHAVNQCWSPGVPDVDCPGSGLCCHDGCTNVCINGYHQIESSFHVHHHHHVSYHVPPNSKYLVPGSQYIPYEVLHGSNPRELGVSELLDQYLNHKANPKHQKVPGHQPNFDKKSHHGSKPEHPSIPPTHGMEEIYSLKELENMELEDYHPHHLTQLQHHDGDKSVILSPPNHYRPPALGYLPPDPRGHTHLSKDHMNLGQSYELPSKSYLPPKADKAAGKHEHLKPPSNDYLPPKAKDSKLGTHYKPPSHGYLPPEKTEEEHHLQSHFEAPSKDYLPPKAESQPEESHENLKPPNKKYLPPKKEKKVLGSHYEPPSHGYLPPKAQDGINVNNHYEMPNHEYLPPDNNKLDDTGQHLKPPSVEYLPPKGEYKGSETDYQPLSVDYLPPTVKETKQINDHYAVPSHDYLPPQDSKENNDHLHLKPPSGEYLPPKGNVPNVGIHYEPPSHGYLPPDSGRKDDTHQHLRPPSGEYLPPKGKVPDIGTHYQPPSHGYLPPQKNLEDDSHQHLEPPSGEYLPPKGNNYEIDTHYQPPSQGYLPPGNKEKDDARQHLEPPSGEYLPPKGKVPDIGTHYQVPSHGYLPPKSSAQDESHQHFKPPSGEYLPPKINGPEIGNHYQPPSQDHLPPKSEAQNHQINDHYETPTHDYLPPKKEKSEHQHLKPPSGEYLPPKGADPEIGTHYKPTSHKYLPPQGKDYSSPDTDTPPKYDQHLKPPSSGYLPPRKEGSKLDALLSPPSHGYLPPNNYEPDHHDDHASNNAHLKPPSSDYLPPKEVEHVGKAQANYSDLKPPSHDYLPPKEVNHVTVTPHSISVSEQYQPSSPGTTPYHVPPSYPTGAPEAQSISIEPNILINGKSYKLDVPGSTAVTVGPNNHHQNALPPHSINIQINIPNKDEFTIGKGIQGLGGSHFHSPEMEDKNYAPKVPEYRPGSPAVEYSGPGEEFNHHESKPSYYPDHETYDDGYGYGFNLPKPQYHNTKDHPPRKYISTKDHLRNYNPQYLPTVPKNLPYPPYLPPSPFPSGPEDGSYLFGYENKDNLYHPPGSQYLPPIDSSIVHPRLLPHTGNGRPNDGPPKLPNYHSHHVENSPDETLSPPKGSYLPPDDYVPPPTPDNYIPPPSEVPSEKDVPEEIPEEILEPPAPTEIDAETISEPSEPPEPFLGLAKLTNGSGLEESNEPKLPPMPTLAPPQPDKFLPLLRELSPDLLKKLGISVNRPNPNAAQANFIPGVPGKDYPDFKSIPPTAFSCENFILEGFYADTFTSCQAFHVCESGKRQSSFLCPRGTIFNQKHRVCDWWYNVKCEDSAEFYDLNLDLILLENKKNRATLSVPPPIDPFSVAGVDSNLLSGLESDSSLLGGFGAQLLNSIGMMNVMNGIDRSDNGQSLDTSKLRIRNRPTKTPLINSLKAPSDDLFKGKQGSFVNKLSDLNQNDIDDMTSDELSKLANSLATLEQLSKDLEHFDDNEMKELLSRKANPPSRLPNNKFLPRSGRIGQPIVASRRSNEAEEESALSESRKASVASSLCEFMNICDNLESSPETHRNYPAKELSETSIDSKIVNPLPVSVETTANPFLRTGEKTASEIAALVAKTKAYLKEKPFDLDVAGSEIREHSVIRTPKLETDNEFRLSDDNMDLDVTTWNPTTSHAFTESQTDVSSSSDWTPIRSLN
ncbi:hypothetical protein TCAL_07593 [Tigriopus californicus]|uniref:WAP domain-containing protein n=1 Tax=Tigriopus californicus TaxID=6832 RepID=A0A553PGB2_TIGCA|nr:hypothetical protein TCAL_07593 [Tigriopus californicus]